MNIQPSTIEEHPEDFDPVTKKRIHYVVPSYTNPNKEYNVTRNPITERWGCDCPVDTYYHRKCKHLLDLEEEGLLW